MSTIGHLIAQLCRNGVEFVPLSDLAPYSETRVDAADLDETTFVGVDNLVADKGGRVDATHSPNTNRLSAFAEGDVLLGNIRPYLKKIWLADRDGGCSGDVLALRIAQRWRNRITPEFLYYLLSADSFFDYNMLHAKGAKMPRGDKAAVLRYRVPVPPMSVQSEIVSILSTFRRLAVELEAEVGSRRAQRVAIANNFAASLGALDEQGKCNRVALGSLARESIEPVKVQPEQSYLSLGVKWNGEGVLAREPRNGDAIKATTLFRARSGQLIYNRMFVVEGSFAIVPEECDQAVVSGEFPLFDVDSSQVEPQWLLHHLCDPYTLKRIEREVTGTERGTMKSRRRWKSDQFAGFEIPLPSLEVQREIVAFLRASEDLIRSLEDEVSARRTQYECYRDKLLAFEELSA